MTKFGTMEWKKDLEYFHEKTQQFYRGELSKNEYKGISGAFGSYAQRGGKASMLRLRLTGGRITKDQLCFIAETIEKYNIDLVHFTTCQTIQLHNLSPKAVCEIIEEAFAHGIITLGGGGDYPRNVMCAPLSGVEKGEYFDVLPYAESAAEYLLTFLHEKKMPRKLKVGFSNGPANTTHATYRDLGFAACADGTFDVYSAGGLGIHPKLGLKIAEHIPPSEILYYICAMRDTFLDYGNYEQRGRARTRFMRDKLGDEGYKKAFLEKLDHIYQSGEKLDVTVEPYRITKKGDGTSASGRRVTAQKQPGLFAVSYHPVGGCPPREIFRNLLAAVQEMEEVECRLSPDAGLYVIHLTGQEAEKILELTKDSAKSLIETSVACIGASVCQAGICDSQKLIREVVKACREAGLREESLPKIHISGCPSSCGTHQTGEIGFHGGIKMVDKVPHHVYTVHLKGCSIQGRECFGNQAGVMEEEQILLFLTELGRTVEESGVSYDRWIRENQTMLYNIARKYMMD